MHRVLSGETSRCSNTGQEFITKKLCLSFVFICAFFSLLGGYFLGKAASVSLFHQHVDECKIYSSDHLNELSLSISRLSNLTRRLSTEMALNQKKVEYVQIFDMFKCDSYDVQLPFSGNPEVIKMDVNLSMSTIIDSNLMVLQRCFNNVSDFLEHALN